MIFDDDGKRRMIQPWVDDMDAHLERAEVEMEPPDASGRPLDGLRRDLASLTGEALLAGIEQTIASGPAEWDRVESLAAALYLSSVSTAIERLRSAMKNAEMPTATAALLELAVLQRLAQEVA